MVLAHNAALGYWLCFRVRRNLAHQLCSCMFSLLAGAPFLSGSRVTTGATRRDAHTRAMETAARAARPRGAAAATAAAAAAVAAILALVACPGLAGADTCADVASVDSLQYDDAESCEDLAKAGFCTEDEDLPDRSDGVRHLCPVSCKACGECYDTKYTGVLLGGKIAACSKLSAAVPNACEKIPNMKLVCPVTCDSCWTTTTTTTTVTTTTKTTVTETTTTSTLTTPTTTGTSSTSRTLTPITTPTTTATSTTSTTTTTRTVTTTLTTTTTTLTTTTITATTTTTTLYISDYGSPYVENCVNSQVKREITDVPGSYCAPSCRTDVEDKDATCSTRFPLGVRTTHVLTVHTSTQPDAGTEGEVRLQYQSGGAWSVSTVKLFGSIKPGASASVTLRAISRPTAVKVTSQSKDTWGFWKIELNGKTVVEDPAGEGGTASTEGSTAPYWVVDDTDAGGVPASQQFGVTGADTSVRSLCHLPLPDNTTHGSCALICIPDAQNPNSRGRGCPASIPPHRTRPPHAPCLHARAPLTWCYHRATSASMRTHSTHALQRTHGLLRRGCTRT